MTDFDAILARTVLFMDIEQAIDRHAAEAPADPAMVEDLRGLIGRARARAEADGRGAPDDFRNLLVDLAARAVAAVEDHDRRHHRREH